MPRRTLPEVLEELGALLARAAASPSSAPGAGPAAQALVQEASALVEGQDRSARLGRLALDLARLFAAQSAPVAFCQAALDAIGDAVHASSGAVLLFEGDGDEARVVAERRTTSDAERRTTSDAERRTTADAERRAAPSARGDGPVPLSRSVLAEVRTTRRTVLLTDARDSRFHRETSVVALDMRSVLATPLVIDDRVAGVIHLENRSLADAFVEADRELLEAVGGLLTPFLQVGARLADVTADRARWQAAAQGDRSPSEIVGRGPAIETLRQVIARVASTDAPVLVTGESGSGKELVARALHLGSRRAAGPLVAVNCAAIPENLMESELFGHERGAFTGATERRKGRFEQAHGGTLFLDEVGELRPELQAKLLRVLQDQVVERVGSSSPVRVDVRVVAATHRDLRQLVREGRFREDLFYRLDVVPVRVPALREHPEDVPALVERFLDEACRSMGRTVRLAPDVLAALGAYSFPGNVRELRNLVHRLVALAPSDVVTAADLPEHVAPRESVSLEKDPFRRFLRTPPRTNEELKAVRAAMQEVLDGYVQRVERAFLQALLDEADGNVSQAARAAGMNRTLFHRKLKQGAADAPDDAAGR